MTRESRIDDAAPPAEVPHRQPSHREILIAMSGLVIAMLLAMLDNMIVAPALPTIVGEMGGLRHLPWVTTGYILASTVSTPIWGKLGDLFGRRRTFITAIVLFLIGSALCGMAQNIAELIGFRTLQGLGGGGLIVGVLAIIGELIPPRERGRYQGVMMAVMPVAMIGGPLLGGFITDHLSWRWTFYVNLPLGVIALAVIGATLKLPRRTGRTVIDWTGAVLLTIWISALVLITSWGGSRYPWSSWQIIGLGALTVLAFATFVAVERKAAEPIMPLTVFANANFSLAGALGLVAGFAMFGAVTFLPQFQQYVQGASAISSGLLLMPMMIAAMVVSLASGQLITKSGRYRALPIVGTALLAAGLLSVSTMGLHTSRTTTTLYLVVLGAGLGCLQTTTLIAQNSVSMREIGAATGAATLLRNLGGSLGVSILGSLYTGRLNGFSAGHDVAGLTPAAVKALPDATRHLFQQAVTNGIGAVFLCAAMVAATGFLLSWFIRHVPLRGNAAPQPPAEAERRPVIPPRAAA